MIIVSSACKMLVRADAVKILVRADAQSSMSLLVVLVLAVAAIVSTTTVLSLKDLYVSQQTAAVIPQFVKLERQFHRQALPVDSLDRARVLSLPLSLPPPTVSFPVSFVCEVCMFYCRTAVCTYICYISIHLSIYLSIYIHVQDVCARVCIFFTRSCAAARPRDKCVCVYTH